MSRQKPVSLDTAGLSLSELEQWGKDLIAQQRSINWYLGDLAIAAKAMLGEDNYSQVFPTETSPGLIQRCEAVARAYAPSERNEHPAATWSIHKLYSNKPNRIELVAAAVEAGRTSDEERKHEKAERDASSVDSEPRKHRWLLAIDVNYHVTRTWASGAGTEAAKQVSEWIDRLIGRLKEKGLTDVVCCLDSTNSFRKDLTKDWEDKYKSRATKDPELVQQLRLAEDMLSHYCCARINGYEADDLMASFARQFDGKVSLLTVDKDMRQCLSSKCNMLVDIQWNEDPTSGEMMPEYKWVSVRDHIEGFTYNGTSVVGITPEQMTLFQAIAGDSSDSISGAEGIGAKIAADLVKEFGSFEEIIKAAKDEDERITEKKRNALIAFEPKYEITKKLVTLHTDLPLPTTTRI